MGNTQYNMTYLTYTKKMFLFSVEKCTPSVLYRDIHFKDCWHEVRSSLKCTPPPPRAEKAANAPAVKCLFSKMLGELMATALVFTTKGVFRREHFNELTGTKLIYLYSKLCMNLVSGFASIIAIVGSHWRRNQWLSLGNVTFIFDCQYTSWRVLLGIF